MAESFKNWDNILYDLVKGRVQKSLVEALNRYEKEEEERRLKPCFSFLENDSEKDRPCRKSSKTTPNTKKIGLQLNYCYIAYLYYCLEIYWKHSRFLSLKIIADTDWYREWNIKKLSK